MCSPIGACPGRSNLAKFCIGAAFITAIALTVLAVVIAEGKISLFKERFWVAGGLCLLSSLFFAISFTQCCCPKKINATVAVTP